jgi:hypothetical protein
VGVGILNFDVATGRWDWDEERAAQSKTSRNVVEMMAHSIRSLPAVTQNLLKLASCIGTTFDLPTLATISGLDPQTAARGLWQALVVGLVVTGGDNYFVMKDNDNDTTNNNNNNNNASSRLAGDKGTSILTLATGAPASATSNTSAAAALHHITNGSGPKRLAAIRNSSNPSSPGHSPLEVHGRFQRPFVKSKEIKQGSRSINQSSDGDDGSCDSGEALYDNKDSNASDVKNINETTRIGANSKSITRRQIEDGLPLHALQINSQLCMGLILICLYRFGSCYVSVPT